MVIVVADDLSAFGRTTHAHGLSHGSASTSYARRRIEAMADDRVSVSALFNLVSSEANSGTSDETDAVPAHSHGAKAG